MAAGNVARVIRAPGRIVLDPTTSIQTTAYPYGGTEIGKTKLCMVQPLGDIFRVEYESLGETGDILEADNHWIFSCFVRGWDDDALSKVFEFNSEATSGSQHRLYSVPNARVPGVSALDRSVILLYVPDDTIHVPGILIYRGVPHWSTGSEIKFQHGEELGMPLAVHCLRDASDDILKIGRLIDLFLN